jgi:hypothetical protein
MIVALVERISFSVYGPSNSKIAKFATGINPSNPAKTQTSAMHHRIFTSVFEVNIPEFRWGIVTHSVRASLVMGCN